jgi:acetolactate synthase-1/2/3 large subunit
MTLPSVTKVAEAFGLKIASINSHHEIRERIREILQAEGPLVCEVMISPNQVTAPRVSSVKNEDGTMSSRPMEDMWPFLDREEFAANMRNI